MELFYSNDIEGGICRLGQDEGIHCIKVLRHRLGDEICVIDGEGNMLRCRIISDNPKNTEARIEETVADFGSHPYNLTMAVCPTKNEAVSVKEFIHSCAGNDNALKMIAYCFEDENIPRRSIKEVLDGYQGKDIIILIGPEGDFSKEEAEMAVADGFIPIHLGASRLRTETAALAAVSAVYFRMI